MELLSFKAKQQTHDQYKKHQRQIQIIVTETRLRRLSVWSRSHDSGSHQQSEELDSRFDSQREVLTHGYGGFEVFLALLTDQFSSQMRSSETTGNTSHCVRSGSKPDISPSPFMETCAPPTLPPPPVFWNYLLSSSLTFRCLHWYILPSRWCWGTGASEMVFSPTVVQKEREWKQS